jgi:hypothetical protein
LITGYLTGSATWRKKTPASGKLFSLGRLLNRVRGSERRLTMKCQSEYGTETDALLTQADECTEVWWEDEPTKQGQTVKQALEEDPSLIVKREVRKRGLSEVSEDTGA